MPSCCRCNGSGKCLNCACKKAGISCTNCLPLRRGKCKNRDGNAHASQHSGSSMSQDQVESIPDTQSPLHQPSSLLSPVSRRYSSVHSNYCHPVSVGGGGGVDSETFTISISSAYAEIVNWKRNFFAVPRGRSGKIFIGELARLYRAYAEGTAMEGVALSAAMVMPTLLLQRPHRSSRTRDHSACLEHLWEAGDINSLILEGRTIQVRLPQRRPTHHDTDSSNKYNTSRSFAKLMHSGKTKAAIRLLSDVNKGSVLHLNDTVNPGGQTVYDTLISKHPKGQPTQPEALLQDNDHDTGATPPIHPILFDSIDASAIRAAALCTFGAAGPSGVDAHEWRRWCTSFQSTSIDLCHSLAKFAIRLCTNYVDPQGLSPFTACRLIALDKNPGVRPIGICETVRRIVSKAVLYVIKDDIQHATGSIQLCAGQIAGIEAAIHATCLQFSLPDTEGVLLVDASNAFNSLNRQTALHNIQVLCPAIATILINTYRDSAQLFMDWRMQESRKGGSTANAPKFFGGPRPLSVTCDNLSVT